MRYECLERSEFLVDTRVNRMQPEIMLHVAGALPQATRRADRLCFETMHWP